MRCLHCKKRFRDSDRVLPILRFVAHDRRADFVRSQPEEFVHFACVVVA